MGSEMCIRDRFLAARARWLVVELATAEPRSDGDSLGGHRGASRLKISVHP